MLQASLLCDDVLSGFDGRLSLYGLVPAISAPGFPTLAPVFFVANAWRDLAQGEHKEMVKIMSPDRGTTLGEAANMLKPAGTLDYHYSITRFAGLAFPAQGRYWVQVHLDGKLATEYSLNVVLVESRLGPGKEKE